MLIRHADPARDAAACAAVYEPYVTRSIISFELTPPDEAEMRARIERITATHPWLVAELDGEVIGFAYGSPHHVRLAYRWSADVSVYLAERAHRRGIGRALYEKLFGLLEQQGFRTLCAGIRLRPGRDLPQRRLQARRVARRRLVAARAAPAGRSPAGATRAPKSPQRWIRIQITELQPANPP
jgi:L-amino acid N-acyltransferase YncA